TIFLVTVPATIIKSAWRGEGRKSSEPKRAISKRPPPDAIISIAQQARPNCMGQIEDLRPQLYKVSTILTAWSSGPVQTFFLTSSSTHTSGLSNTIIGAALSTLIRFLRLGQEEITLGSFVNYTTG